MFFVAKFMLKKISYICLSKKNNQFSIIKYFSEPRTEPEVLIENFDPENLPLMESSPANGSNKIKVGNTISYDQVRGALIDNNVRKISW